MEEGKPSRTASMVALMRVHHFLAPGQAKILRDEAALALSGLKSADEVFAHVEVLVESFAQLSDRETAKLFVRRIEESVCMRARLVEEKLREMRGQGLSQFVILGAGLDSTAYRFLEVTKNLAMFEVDFPATQHWKRRCLDEAGIAIPENLQFVSTDFEKMSLAQTFQRAGIDRAKPTLFSWLGVQPYLTRQVVASTLSVLGAFAKGSTLVMDFIQPDNAINDQENRESLADLEKTVAQMREPFKSRFSENEIEDCLRAAGFNQIDFFSTGEMVKRYLDGNQALTSMPAEAVYLLAAQI